METIRQLNDAELDTVSGATSGCITALVDGALKGMGITRVRTEPSDPPSNTLPCNFPLC